MENRSVDDIVKQSLDDFEVKYKPQDWGFMEEALDAEESTPLDETVKSKLQDMEVPYVAASWLAMESALDSLGVEDIDEVAKSALDNFETSYNPSDWSIMGAMLDAEMPNEIDEMAKTALADYAVPLVPIHWEIMDMELDDAGFPNEMDEAARAALNRYESAMPSDWAAMETSLVKAEDVRRQLIFTKSIEVFLFVFAIWTVGNFLPFKQKASTNSIANAIVNVEKSQSQANVNNTANLSIVESATNTEVNTANTTDSRTTTNTDVNTTLSQGNMTERNVTTSQAQRLSNATLQPVIKPSNKGTEVEQMTKTMLDEISTPSNGNKEETAKGKTDNQVLAETVPTLNVSPLDELLVTYPNKKGPKLSAPKKGIAAPIAAADISISPLSSKTLFVSLNEEDEVLPKSSVSNKYKYYPFRIKVAVGVQSSSFFKSKEFEKRKSATGFSTRLGVDYAISEKIELTSGITYSKEAYTYQEQSAFANYSTLHTVRNVEMDIIQVPVRMNYNIKANDKTRLYAVGGLTGGVIMKVDNEISTSLASNITNLRSGAEDFNPGVSSNGVLQDGEISTSSFITADIGMGLEYQMNRRLSFYIEPLFQRSIKKIGLEDENYQNYALSLGTRVVL